MNKQTKRIIMKNITKVGLSALAGSLVMVSANAVEYSMSGALKSVYSTQDSPTTAETTNGKGLTTATDLTFANIRSTSPPFAKLKSISVLPPSGK